MGEGTTGARRRRNPEQTRGAIIDALLAAVKEGIYAPTVKDIAQRAGASERSIFVHFTGIDDLRIAAVDRQSEQVEALIRTIDPELPLDRRIDLVVEQSAGIFALQRHPRVLGLLESQSLPALDARMRLTDSRIRAALAHAFRTELTRSGEPDEQLLDMIDATVGWPFRHHLVARRGLSRAAASAAVRRALVALLDADHPVRSDFG
ncbi:TetR/AcrR family transcriptional regulator [Nocardia lijiangensis]|uniref:TetR/AcrR family transcriptional regulator n=1 Tax=Nocardia lijiangensis TaxID=299618 RepID=UPI000829B6BC|nr:TetR/AcrR family transcriptional regulator [Nocardia lijiangensis]